MSDEIAVGTRVRDWEGKTGTVIPVGAAHPYQVPNEVLVRLDEPLYGNRDYFYSVRKLAVIDQEEDGDVVADEPEHDCDKEYRHDCASCNGVAPGDVGTW